MNRRLANIAKQEAQKNYHGSIMKVPTNLQPIAELFPASPTWQLQNWDNSWCAAFVYFCCINAGINLPVRYESEHVTCNFAGCIAWEQWSKLPNINLWHSRDEKSFIPEIGDIVLFDRVILDEEHDHIAIIIDVYENHFVSAEGNFNNISAVVTRIFDEHIRGYIRLNRTL